jgi:predicted metalloprotease
MRWRNPRKSGNIEDRRGMRRVPMKAVGGGIGGLIVLILTLLLSGGDPGMIFNDNTNNVPVNPGSYYEGTPISNEDRELTDFVSVVLADTEDTWNEIFAAENLEYREPILVLFSRAVESACGFAESAVGPFYCSVDERLDTTCRTSLVLWRKSIVLNSRSAAKLTQTDSLSCRSCRLIVLQASGHITPTGLETFLSKAT